MKTILIYIRVFKKSCVNRFPGPRHFIINTNCWIRMERSDLVEMALAGTFGWSVEF